jgi:hypothetical protein
VEYSNRSSHPELVRAFARLFDLLSLSDRRSLFGIVIARVYFHENSIRRSIRTGAYVTQYTAAGALERTKRPDVFIYVMVILYFIYIQYLLWFRGGCFWTDLSPATIIPSGK